MIYRQRGANEQRKENARHKHEDVCQQESEQVSPAKCPAAELFLADHRPAESETTLNPKKRAQTKQNLAERNDPRDLLGPVVMKNEQRQHGQLRCRSKQHDWNQE